MALPRSFPFLGFCSWLWAWPTLSTISGMPLQKTGTQFLTSQMGRMNLTHWIRAFVAWEAGKICRPVHGMIHRQVQGAVRGVVCGRNHARVHRVV